MGETYDEGIETTIAATILDFGLLYLSLNYKISN